MNGEDHFAEFDEELTSQPISSGSHAQQQQFQGQSGFQETDDSLKRFSLRRLLAKMRTFLLMWKSSNGRFWKFPKNHEEDKKHHYDGCRRSSCFYGSTSESIYRDVCFILLDSMPDIPDFHVAIIMDGNRRWAKMSWSLAGMGHRKALKYLMRLFVLPCGENISHFLYALSTKIWRESERTQNIYQLLKEYITKKKRFLENSVSVSFPRNLALLPHDVRSRSCSLRKNERRNRIAISNLYHLRRKETKLFEEQKNLLNRTFPLRREFRNTTRFSEDFPSRSSYSRQEEKTHFQFSLVGSGI